MKRRFPSFVHGTGTLPSPSCPATAGFRVLPRRYVVSAAVQLHAAELAQQLGGQWNYITSCGPDTTQTVFHLHGHLVPRTADDGLALPWPRPACESGVMCGEGKAASAPG